MLVGENFAHGAVVLVGHPAVGEDVIEVIVHRIAGGAGFRPFVFVGGVVENKVHHHGDAGFTQGLSHFAQVFNIAERGIHFAIAAHRITAVALAFRAFEQWHQVQIGEAEFLEIGDGIDDALQIAGK